MARVNVRCWQETYRGSERVGSKTTDVRRWPRGGTSCTLKDSPNAVATTSNEDGTYRRATRHLLLRRRRLGRAHPRPTPGLSGLTQHRRYPAADERTTPTARAPTTRRFRATSAA